MALNRICDVTNGGTGKFKITNVTEDIRVVKGGTGVLITTINAGNTWTSSSADDFVGIYIGNTLIAVGAAYSVIGKTGGCWVQTNETGAPFITSLYIPPNSKTIFHLYADIPEATTSSIRVSGNLVESVTVNNGTAQSLPHTFDLNAGINTMVIEGAPRLEHLAIEGDYDSVTYGSSSYPKPADITLDPATSVLTVVNPVKEITVKYTDTNEPTVTVTTTM